MKKQLPYEDFFELTLQNNHTSYENLFTFSNPFDFFRHEITENPYLLKTQHKLRQAFSEGLLGIEHYLIAATSIRPLIDEAQDLDEITRLFSQQKLAMRPTLHSVTILRSMIKDPNPEIALYAAEGLNTIESTFLNKIEKIRRKLATHRKNHFIYHYLLGCVYNQFAILLEHQKLIQQFYIAQAIENLKIAYSLRPHLLRIKIALAESYFLNKNYELAVSLYAFCYAQKYKPVYCLLKMAECHYQLKNYDTVKSIVNLLSHYDLQSHQEAEVIVYQWIL